MRRRRLFPFLLAGLTLLLAGLILTDWLPALRGPAPDTSEWHWPYVLRPQSRWWLPLLAAVVLWLFSTWWVQQRFRRLVTAVGLVGLVGGSLLLQLGLVYAHRPEVTAELVDRTLSHLTNGYFTAAADTGDMNNLLRTFPQVMPTLPSEHTRTHPPGLILAHWLTIRAGAVASPLAPAIYPLRCTDLWLFNQPPATVAALGVWAFLPLVAAAFTVVPVYFLGSRLYDKNVARLAAVFTAALPSLLLFAPTPDQLFALLSALILLIWLAAVRRRSVPYAFLAGLLLSLSTFFSLGNGALAVVLVGYALWQINLQSKVDLTVQASGGDAARHRDNNLYKFTAVAQWFLWFLAGLGSVWLVYWVGWGVAPWEVSTIALQQHYELVTNWRRYDWWLVYNLVDIVLFAGPVVALGFAAACYAALRRFLSGTKRAADGLALALSFLIIALDLSGSTRGEVARIWLFLMPILTVVATGHLFSRPADGQPGLLSGGQAAGDNRTFMLLLAAQLILVLSIGLAWKSLEAVIVVAQRPEMPPLTTPENEVSITFGETIRLIGYDFDTKQAAPGGVLNVTLYWQAEGAAARPYTVFTHLINQDGELVTQKDNWPVNGQWPPSCWKRDEIVVDSYMIQLPDDLPPGSYSLQVGFYEAGEGIRLFTSGGQDAFVLAAGLVIGD